MRVLLAVLLVGIAGCGGGSSPPSGGTVPTTEGSQSKADKSPAQSAAAVAALVEFGVPAQDAQGNVVGLGLEATKITDAELVHLKGLTRLRLLKIIGSKVTAAGIAGLKKALPNCKILKYK